MRGSRATIVVALALLLPAATAAGCSGCSSNDTEPPEAGPAPTPPPSATMSPDEDAGADADTDADASDGAKPKAGGDPTGIRVCCDAVRKNQKIAPADQQLAYGAAILACDAALGSSDARRELAKVRLALSKAGVPAQCN